MSSIIKILSFTRQFWPWYLFMGFFIIATSALSLASPLLTKQIVDLIVAKVTGIDIQISRFYWLLIAIIAIDIFASLITALAQWVGDLLALRLQTFLSTTFYRHILNLHVGYYDDEITGKIINKMYRGIGSISDFIQDVLNNFLPFFLTAIVTIILLANYSLVISGLLFILFPLYIIISHQSSQSWGKIENQKNSVNDLSQGRVFESLTGIRIIKSFASELIELKAFIFARHEIENLGTNQSRQWHLFDLARRLLLNIILFSIFTYIIYQTFIGIFSIGEMTLLIQLVNQARWPLFAMSYILGQVQQASAGSADFFRVLATKSKVIDQPSAKKLELISRQTTRPIIEFKNVIFGYQPEKPVIKNISFSLPFGKKLALVAESGQGKSTIINLLLRYYQPQSGQIYINDQDISEITQSSLRRHIAVVFQESLLFSGTIYENIIYGRPSATKNEVYSAALAANAAGFIAKLPNGYQSLVGERGVKLSGGQKQRIAIARAILKDAPIIVLDEATSSLDSRSELLVQKGLNRLMKNKTSIVIAHRLSTISSADLILAIDHGKMVQFGHPNELLSQKNGLYSRLISIQKHLLDTPSDKISQQLKQFDLVG